MKAKYILLVTISALILPMTALASREPAFNYINVFPAVFLFIAALLMAGRIGALVERFHQPAVLGELLMGVLLAAVAFLPSMGIIKELANEPLVMGIAEIGVILLMFKTGMESNLQELKSVGEQATAVALVGFILPFIGGYFAGKILMPGYPINTYLFLGATLTATSVGISVRVFKDLKALGSRGALTVLGAAIIDDILGLLILSIIAGIISAGTVQVGEVIELAIKAFVFLAATVVLGRAIAPSLGSVFSRIHSGIGMKMALALLVCAIFSYAASALAGLAPIIGAFAAGLVLDPVHFESFIKPKIATKLRHWAKHINSHKQPDDQKIISEMEAAAVIEEDQHVENLIENIGNFFIPIFFVYSGLQVNLSVFADIQIVIIAIAITMIAIAGKAISGFAAGKGVNHALVGFGMVPRGEVGLIFVNVGKHLGVINDQVFAIMVAVIILTTLFTPPLLGMIIREERKAAA